MENKNMFIKEILEKIFIPPFKFDGLYIWDSKMNMVADRDEMYWEHNNLIHNIVDKMNDYANVQPIEELSVKYDNEDSYILKDNEIVLQMRGWGYLTSPNACHFSNTYAAKIQEEFAKWIIKQCKK